MKRFLLTFTFNYVLMPHVRYKSGRKSFQVLLSNVDYQDDHDVTLFIDAENFIAVMFKKNVAINDPAEAHSYFQNLAETSDE